MKENRLFLVLLFFSLVIHSQKHITSISIGYNINNGYKSNGWEDANWKEETNLKYKAKSFLLNHKEKRAGDDIQEYLYYGGKNFTILTFFHKASGEIVAIKESSGITKPKLYGLKWYNNILENKKNLSSRVTSIIELDNYNNKQKLHKYYSIFIKDKEASSDKVQVFTIKDNLITKEEYLAKSNYSSESWVSNPYKKISLKEKFNKSFNRDKVLKTCMEAVGKDEKGKELCECAISKISKSLKGDTSDEFLKYIGDCGDELSSSKKKKRNIYYQTIVNLNLRDEPNVNSNVILMIPKFDAVFSKEIYTDFENEFSINEKKIKAKWVKVVYGDNEGWLFLGGMRLTEGELYADQQYYKSLKK